MKFSVFSVSVPEWTPAESSVNLKEMGYDGIAWRVIDQQESAVPDFWIGNRSTWPLTGFEESLPEMAALAADTGLEVAALYGYPRWCDRPALHRHFAAAAELNVKACRVVGPGTPTHSAPDPQLGLGHYDELLEASRRDFTWMADCAKSYGVKAVTPLHHQWVNSSASAARRLLDGLDPESTGIIMDTGHLIIEGSEDILATVQILGPFLDSVMLKNYVWEPARTRTDGTVEWEYRMETIRKGKIDIFDVFAALHAEGFDGWVTIAEATKELPLRERLTDVLQYVKSAVAATSGARREDWVYDYGPRGGHWAGTDTSA